MLLFQSSKANFAGPFVVDILIEVEESQFL